MSGELVDLAEAVDSLDLHADVQTLAEVLAIADRLQAKVARLAGAVDAAGDADGGSVIETALRLATSE